jgi:hypothetical protein
LSCKTNVLGKSKENDYDVSANTVKRHDFKLDVVHYHNDELGKEKFHKWPQNVCHKQINELPFLTVNFLHYVDEL